MFLDVYIYIADTWMALSLVTYRRLY